MSLSRGVLVPSGQPMDLTTRCRAARLQVPASSVFSHHTAAELYCVPAPRDSQIHISLISDVEPRIRGVSAHRPKELPEPRWIKGFPVTPPGRTFVDLASKLALPDLVAVGDALSRRDGSTDDLKAAVDAGGKRRGIVLARTALQLVDPRARSAPESHLRVLLTLAGMAPDFVNEEVVDEFGRYLFQPDLGYWVRLSLEYEGRHHQSDPRQYESDIHRDGGYRDHQWHLIKVTSEMLYQRPHELVSQVAKALHQLGWRPGGSTPTPRWAVPE